MRKIGLLLIGICLICSCSPQAYTMLVDIRYPSDKGVDLTGKSISVLYLQSPSSSDRTFCDALSDGLVKGLESDYFEGEPSVDIFSIPMVADVSYASRDTLINYVMTTGSDVVILVDNPEFSNLKGNTIDCTSKIYLYDSMNSKDELIKLTRKDQISSALEASPTFVSDAQYIGYCFARYCAANWQEEQYSVLYFDDYGPWYQALDLAYQLKWKEAMEVWLTLTQTDNLTKRSSAAYNLALGCYMLGEYPIALEWLDSSDKDMPLSLSDGLRKRIKARM